ncbi:hypothetical protein V1509DRAFT_635138 [Lipomyces kononenkoae]
MSSPPPRSSPEVDNYVSDPSTEDLLAQFSALSAPTYEPRLREPSPDALGSIDALTDRFTKLFNRGPVSGSTHPVTSYADENIDPRIFLATNSTSEPLTLKEEHKWKELPEVDENDFEEALRELSAKEWELSAEELDELQYLESTLVVPAGAKNGDSGMMDGGYLNAMVNNLNTKARDEAKPANIVEKKLDHQGYDEEKLGLFKHEEKVDPLDRSDPSDEKEIDEKMGYSAHYGNRKAHTDAINFSDGHVAESQADQRDIDEQADRLVEMYTSSGIRDKSVDDEGDDKDEDEEAEELVDMYVRLASDDEEEEHDDDVANQGLESDILDDDGNDDVIARLQNLKLPETDFGDNPLSTVTDITDLPDVPTVILPSVTTNNNNITSKLQEDAELGCCMCSDDVEYRCLNCEKLDEDYLYCSKCFLLSHLSEQAGYDERSHRYKKFRL